MFVTIYESTEVHSMRPAICHAHTLRRRDVLLLTCVILRNIRKFDKEKTEA